MIVVSPWSKGGWVNSQLFDHTSLIRFLEARFADEAPDLIETNITPWRRAVAGDLTSVFDFGHPNARRVALPGTAGDAPPDTTTKYPDQPLVAPGTPALPRQERGVRPARSLPYALHAHASVMASQVTLMFTNVGHATAVFHVRSTHGEVPRSYTVEPGKSLTGAWASQNGGYDLSVYGPNGFYRHFTGSSAPIEVTARYGHDENLKLTIANTSTQPVVVTVTDAYTGHVRRRSVAAGATTMRTYDLDDTGGWYDLTIEAGGHADFVRRLAGHMENGNDSISDPALGVRLPLG